jgi:hypothetical protein
MPTTLYPNFESGASALEQQMLTIDPRARVDEERLASFADGSGLDGVFLAGALSLMLTHERNCVIAFNALGNATVNPMLKAAYTRFGEDALVAVEAYEQAIFELGGDVQYVSPAAMLTEAIDSKMLEALLLSGTADPMTLDVKTISIAASGAANCVINEATLRAFVEAADDGEATQVLTRLADAVGPPAREHMEWCVSTHAKLAAQAAQHPVISKFANKAEELAVRATRKLSGQ